MTKLPLLVSVTCLLALSTGCDSPSAPLEDTPTVQTCADLDATALPDYEDNEEGFELFPCVGAQVILGDDELPPDPESTDDLSLNFSTDAVLSTEPFGASGLVFSAINAEGALGNKETIFFSLMVTDASLANEGWYPIGRGPVVDGEYAYFAEAAYTLGETPYVARYDPIEDRLIGEGRLKILGRGVAFPVGGGAPVTVVTGFYQFVAEDRFGASVSVSGFFYVDLQS